MPYVKSLHPRDMPKLKAAEKAAGTWVKANHKRPKTRADCANVPRPCPYVGCRHHLFLEVTMKGGIKMPYGDDVGVLESMPQTCSLDQAETGEMELRHLSKMLSLTDEGTLLIANSAYARLLQTRAVQEQSNGQAPNPRHKIMSGKPGRQVGAPFRKAVEKPKAP